MLLTFNSFRHHIPRATRAALAILIPGIIGYLLGFGPELLLVSAGAVLLINGENKPYRERWKSLLRYGLLFTSLTLGFRLLGIWSHSHGQMDFPKDLAGSSPTRVARSSPTCRCSSSSPSVWSVST